MTIKHLYPNSRPTLDLKFAKDKTLDPRITFTRASSGTYVDENGVIQSAATNAARFDHDPETGESLGLLVEEARTNILLYSDTLTGAAWGTLDATLTPNAAFSPASTYNAGLLTDDVTTAYHGIRYPVTVGGGSVTVFSVFVKYLNARYIQFASESASSGVWNVDLVDKTASRVTGDVNSTLNIQELSGGWLRISYKYTWGANNQWPNINIVSSLSSVHREVRLGVSGNGVYLWGAQLEAGSFPTSYIPTPATFTSRASTATYYDASGVIQTAGVNVARDNAYFPDENGVMQPAGLLLEGSGTNHTYPSIIPTSTTGRWTIDGLSITANAGTAPDGSSTASLIDVSTGTGGNRAYVYAGNQGIKTYSFFAKANTSDAVLGLYMMDAFVGGTRLVTYTFNTDAITVGSSSYSVVREKISNGWVRISITATTSGPFHYISFNQWFDGTRGSAGQYFLWGFQEELGSTRTSYIPTAGSTVTRAADVSSSSTVTRAADVASITGSNFSSWYNQSEGSWYISYNKKLSPVNISNVGVLGPQHFYYRGNSTESVRRFGSNIAATGMAANNNRIAIGYDSTDFDISANGNIANNNIVATPTSQTTLNVMSNGLSTLSSTVARLTYYPTRLSNAILQNLTT
jgi:hypothetical protein